MIKSSLAICLLLASLLVNSQRPIDVLQYKYEIEISDQSDILKGKATITVQFVQPVTSLSFDLISFNPKTGKDFKASLQTGTGKPTAKAVFKNDKFTITLLTKVKTGESRTFVINYSGIPEDGLIISKNKFGKRTFFSDNWPNRARFWIPCVDDPADKAPVEFIITAPDHYQVISNGVEIEKKQLADNKKMTHWKEDVPLPTKIMAVGIADFAVLDTARVNGIPVSTWVFEGNKDKGFYDYAPARDILAFFIDYIGPYPYKKLANVQSLTIFGGMENADAIFYAENSVTGKQDQQSLLSHEIAHQWFGDMVTEKAYPHLWLSEGFATFFSIFYAEKKDGWKEAATQRNDDRRRVIAFVKNFKHPVVDSITPTMELLNANSYQKGGWILHMLRRELGDELFQKCIRAYYAAYNGKNTDTQDFEHMVETVSGKDLSVFFRQWLYTPGIPQLDVQWKYDPVNKKIDFSVKQLQSNIYQFPLEILIATSSSPDHVEKLNIKEAVQQFSFTVAEKPSKLALDPAVNLLFDGKLTEMK